MQPMRRGFESFRARYLTSLIAVASCRHRINRREPTRTKPNVCRFESCLPRSMRKSTNGRSFGCLPNTLTTNAPATRFGILRGALARWSGSYPAPHRFDSVPRYHRAGREGYRRRPRDAGSSPAPATAAGWPKGSGARSVPRQDSPGFPSHRCRPARAVTPSRRGATPRRRTKPDPGHVPRARGLPRRAKRVHSRT